MILLDTNVLSEVLRPVPAEPVLSWLAAQDASAVFTSTITQAEILFGIESLPTGKRRAQLLAAFEKISAEAFPDRILPFDEAAAPIFAKIVASRNAAGRPISQFDAMIAAIARSCDMSLATRNIRDFEHCGLRIINPWQQ